MTTFDFIKEMEKQVSTYFCLSFYGVYETKRSRHSSENEGPIWWLQLLSSEIVEQDPQKKMSSS